MLVVRMSVSGLCAVCDQPDVDHSCDRCGQLVCDRHWNERTGLCAECAAEMGRGRDQSGDRVNREDMPDGVDTYRF